LVNEETGAALEEGRWVADEVERWLRGEGEGSDPGDET
jgi:hypothetical protein